MTATTKTDPVEEIIGTLYETYELVYVDQSDSFSDDQVAAIISCDYETLDDSIFEIEADQQDFNAHAAANHAMENWMSDHPEVEVDEHEVLDALEEVIRDRDTADHRSKLARRTTNPMMRVQVVAEDAEFTQHGEAEPQDFLEEIGLPVTAENIATMQNLMADTPSEVYMAYAIFTADVERLMDTMSQPEAVVTVENPSIAMGNPFTGAYWDAQFDGTLTFQRKNMVSDGAAFGYSVEETYGGYITDVEAEITSEE